MTESKSLEKTVKKELKYPEKWDTVAYPDVLSALWETYCWQKAELGYLKKQIKGILKEIERIRKYTEKRLAIKYFNYQMVTENDATVRIHVEDNLFNNVLYLRGWNDALLHLKNVITKRGEKNESKRVA